MKLNFTLFFFLVVASFYATAQITVTENDFANAGDDVWMSTAQSDNSISYQYGGADTTWNFSVLQLSSQTYDQFLNPLTTNAIYALYYSNVSFNSNRSNIAIQESNPTSVPLVTLTDVYNFYYKNSSGYVQKGIGETINGIPTNVGYNSPDTLYTFPLLYGSTSASTSGYSLNIPSLGYYGYSQTRTNTVDGWGLVATPYGTFQALRMVSQISSYDSLYIDTFHFGFKLNLPDQRQYEWIANGELEPVLQINTTVISGNIELINSIIYRDSLHPPVTGISGPTENPSPDFTVFPNPVHNDLNIRFNADIAHTSYAVYDMDGRLINTGEVQQKTEHLNTSNWARGMYIVTITTPTQTEMQKVVVQ